MYSTCKLLLATKSAGKHTQFMMGGPKSVTPRLFREGWREKIRDFFANRMQIAVSCKWPCAMKVMEQYKLVLHCDTISLQTRSFFNSDLGRVRIGLLGQPVLRTGSSFWPNWPCFGMMISLVMTSSDSHFCGILVFHLLGGRSDRPQFWQKVDVLILHWLRL